MLRPGNAWLIYFANDFDGVIKMAKPTPDIIKEYKSIVVWSKNPGMVDTGVQVKKGDFVTIVAEGEINVWPAKEGYIKSPYGTLLFRVGKDNVAQRYGGNELTTVYSEGQLYLGYVGLCPTLVLEMTRLEGSAL